MSINGAPFPIGGKLPLHEKLRRILSRQEIKGTWHYALDDGTAVAHEAVLSSIEANALFAWRQQVFMGRNGWRTVVARKWSFRFGITFYRVADPRRNVASQWIPEDRMVAFTANSPEPPAPDSPREGEPPPGRDLQCVM